MSDNSTPGQRRAFRIVWALSTEERVGVGPDGGQTPPRSRQAVLRPSADMLLALVGGSRAQVIVFPAPVRTASASARRRSGLFGPVRAPAVHATATVARAARCRSARSGASAATRPVDPQFGLIQRQVILHDARGRALRALGNCLFAQFEILGLDLDVRQHARDAPESVPGRQGYALEGFEPLDVWGEGRRSLPDQVFERPQASRNFAQLTSRGAVIVTLHSRPFPCRCSALRCCASTMAYGGGVV